MVKPLLPQVDVAAITSLQAKPVQAEVAKEPENPVAKLQAMKENKAYDEAVIAQSYEEELKKRDGRLAIVIRTKEHEFAVVTSYAQDTGATILN